MTYVMSEEIIHKNYLDLQSFGTSALFEIWALKPLLYLTTNVYLIKNKILIKKKKIQKEWVERFIFLNQHISSNQLN